MPRAPDWLLGFGFVAKDKKLLESLDKMQGKLKDLAATMKEINKGSATGHSEKSISKSLGLTGRESAVKAVESLGSEMDLLFSRVSKGLQKINRDGRDVGLVLHRQIGELFEEIEKGSFKGAKNLEQIPAVLLQIPLLSKQSAAGLKKLHGELLKQKDGHDALVSGVRSMRKEIMKAVQESSGFEEVETRAGGAARKMSEFMHSFFFPSDATAKMLSGAGEFFDLVGGKIQKKFGDVLNIDVGKKAKKILSNIFRDRNAERWSETIQQTMHSMQLGPTERRRFKTFADTYYKRLALPSRLLARTLGRVPLLNRIVGKPAQMRTTSAELRKIVEQTDEVHDFSKFLQSEEGKKLEKDFGRQLRIEEWREMMSANVTEQQTKIEQAIDEMTKQLASGPASPSTQVERAMERAMAAPEVAASVQDKAKQIGKEIEKGVKRADPATPIEDAFRGLVEALHYDVAPAVAEEISQLWTIFRRGHKHIAEEADGLTKAVADGLRSFIAHDLDPLPNKVWEVLAESKRHIAEFGDFLDTWVREPFSQSWNKFRDRIETASGTFNLLKDSATSAFTNILLEKELFVQKVEENFKNLADKVTRQVGRISIVSADEFRQMASEAGGSFERMEELAQRNVTEQTQDLGRAFANLRSRISRESGPLVENLEAIGKALKKAVGLNPAPVLAILSRLGPALARVGPAAGRAIPGMEGIAGAARGGAAGGGAGGFSFKDQIGQLFKQKLVGMAEGRASEGIDDRISQLTSIIRGERSTKIEMPEGSGRAERDAAMMIIDAINALGSRLSGQLAKVAAASQSAAVQGEVSGKLKVSGDDMMRAVSGIANSLKGLKGMAR